MTTPDAKNDTFYAGICMAGAVSAGAYTAGVIDYLLEALEHWEQAKKLQAAGKLSNVPTHNFKIEVIGGASAGGMTAAITSAAIQNEFEPVHQSDEHNKAHTEQNPLFNSWVNLTETPDKDMMSIMLDTSDIENDKTNNRFKEVRSGLNSTFIKEVADKQLNLQVTKRYPRSYVANDLEVFTTITNLRGFNYEVSFHTSSGTRKHRMKMHRDYAFFRMNDKEDEPIEQASTSEIKEQLEDNDGRIPINFNKKLNIEVLKQAAMSTGAFPVGLESRDLVRKKVYIENNKYLNLRLTGKDTVTADGAKPVQYDLILDDDFLSLNVDGGVINNEPYEITQQLLNDRLARLNGNDKPFEAKTSATEFNSVVLMVDPFPNDDVPVEQKFVVKKSWLKVLPSILSAMRGQLMMKDEQIKRAYMSDDYTRFLIMPVRTKDNIEQLFTIACGCLGGFGGFFSKDFRKHDFFLGRRNCQRFLQVHFSAPVSADNEILKNGYANTTGYAVGADGVEYYPLIPDIRIKLDAATGNYVIEKPAVEGEYAYPSIKLSYILGLEDKIKKRVKAIVNNITNSEQVTPAQPVAESPILKRIRKKSFFGRLFGNVIGTPVTNFYVSIGKKFSTAPIAEKCIDAIITDMESRGLIQEDV
ncbi:patatin-like phospholipase family protein [Mucilaginibacter sp. JRF]|uniref:patatin-like phospholipase family protein n=1 Tax=Mucilaginibacter sp. JRF TaxID=2780088 RepID=UPI0018822D1B|nr:patatin-like phospholipase family protein [Mucilaginibacter sp. JRF]MBE9585511.1 patatin-like phospholipase family protein [Mucilaginibacter sp. JRF]